MNSNFKLIWGISVKKVLLIPSFCVAFLIPLTSNTQTFPKQPKPWRDVYNISLQGFEFSHPMTVLNQDELEIIKHRSNNYVEPQKTAYAELLSEAAIQLNFELLHFYIRCKKSTWYTHLWGLLVYNIYHNDPSLRQVRCLPT